MEKKLILLGSPEYYGVEEGEIDLAKAREQFLRLKAHIEKHDYKVKVVPGQKPWYDSVYITNTALIVNDFAIIARFGKPQRRGEEEITANYLKNTLGLRLRYLPDEEGIYFEGNGDCKFSHNNTHLWIGYGTGRTTLKGVAAVEKILKEELKHLTPIIHPMRIIDRKTFHIDLCLLPLPSGKALYHSTFSPAAKKELEKVFGEKNLIKVPAKYFYACNSVVLDEKNILTPRLGDDFRHWMYNATKMKVDAVNVSQFQEGNGSVQCMVLNVFEVPLCPQTKI
jgi:N-dimethylarginine dimethylaminohydrolase